MTTPAQRTTDLHGLRVVLLRSADRAGGMVQELIRRGAEVQLLPLIDFEFPQNTGALDAALGQPEGYDWLVVTSITTVSALKQRADALRTDLPALLGSLRIAAVGTMTLRALEAERLHVSLVPHNDQSAVGLLAELPAGTGRILLPQADLADKSLEQGLTAKGWNVDAVVAYRTVDYPAAAEHRLTVPGVIAGGTAQAHVLDRAGLQAALAAGTIDAVVVSSPSIAKRFAAVAGAEAAVAIVAIGARTAAAIDVLGQQVAGTAAAPTPEGIADAVAAAVVIRRSSTNSHSSIKGKGASLS